MAALPELRSKMSIGIDAWYEANQEARDDLTLRCSSLGKPCDRQLWYAFRWAVEKEKFSGRTLRIFENGNIRERVILDMLRGAGIDVREIDENTGSQFRVSLASGVLTGSCDGKASNVPDAPKTEHLIEIKTMNDKRWLEWRRKGVKASDPAYYVQVQLYMHGFDLTRCLFVSENQNTREVEAERIHYDPLFAAQQVDRAARIARADTAPPRISDDPNWFQCRFCPAHSICHNGATARRNCRTCLASATKGGAWSCQRNGHDLTPSDQSKGCSVHLYLPSLVNGEQVDADLDRGTVTYRMAGGETFIDGGVA